MKKNDYDDIRELLGDLEEDIYVAMATNMDEKIKEVYATHIETDVYQAYEPSHYTRRYTSEGGFADEDNFKSDIFPSKNGLEYELTNEAEPMYDRKYRLDEIIEDGIYDFNKNPGKREVYENTQREIDSTNIAEKTIEIGLKRKGWDLK